MMIRKRSPLGGGTLGLRDITTTMIYAHMTQVSPNGP
jgi:hypothetical protein